MPHNYNESTTLHAADYPDLVAEQEYALPLRSALGAGCCWFCGRPSCDGGQECGEYSDEEWAALMGDSDVQAS